MQRLLRSADWNADAVRDAPRSFAVERLGPGAYATPAERAQIDRELYLPRAWTLGNRRREAFGPWTSPTISRSDRGTQDDIPRHPVRRSYRPSATPWPYREITPGLPGPTSTVSHSQ